MDLLSGIDVVFDISRREHLPQFTPKGEDGLFIVDDGEIASDYSKGLVEVIGIGLPIEQTEPEDEESE